jgi:HTH-type transcriptional regulator / antitoxin HigA
LIGRHRASEILDRIRPLTLDMIRTVSKQWNIPIGALTPQYELSSRARLNLYEARFGA